VSETTVTSKTDESGLALNFEDVTFHKMGDQGEMHVIFAISVALSILKE
jgi:hypothetical protein